MLCAVRLDYEYFDKNSAGILQERLNRDANELGNNMIMFPARNIQRIAFILFPRRAVLRHRAAADAK